LKEENHQNRTFEASMDEVGGRVAGIKPSPSMRQAASEGLRLFSDYQRGGTSRRLELGKEIALGQPLEEKEWRSIAGWQARNWGKEDPESLRPYPDGGPDARYIASQILGGDKAFEEAINLIPELNKN
jgi:hypothetical protein